MMVIGVTDAMTLVLVFIGLRAQWCEGRKKHAERKCGQNNFSKFHFFSCEVERIPPRVSSKFCARSAGWMRTEVGGIGRTRDDGVDGTAGV
jgi:hypothetical protein